MGQANGRNRKTPEYRIPRFLDMIRVQLDMTTFHLVLNVGRALKLEQATSLAQEGNIEVKALAPSYAENKVVTHHTAYAQGPTLKTAGPHVLLRRTNGVQAS